MSSKNRPTLLFLFVTFSAGLDCSLSVFVIDRSGIRQIKYADARNDSELTINATLYPKRSDTMPPVAAPNVSWRNRVECIRAFAGSSSRGFVRFGSDADFAPSKKTV